MTKFTTCWEPSDVSFQSNMDLKIGVTTLHLTPTKLGLRFVSNSRFNFYRENSFAIEFRVGGLVGRPLDFSISQSPNPSRLETFDLVFWLDNIFSYNRTPCTRT